jgi:rRNA maturation endonuclease Nob1
VVIKFKIQNVFTQLGMGVMSFYLTQGIEYVCISSVFKMCCVGIGLVMGSFPMQGIL